MLKRKREEEPDDLRFELYVDKPIMETDMPVMEGDEANNADATQSDGNDNDDSAENYPKLTPEDVLDKVDTEFDPTFVDDMDTQNDAHLGDKDMPKPMIQMNPHNSIGAELRQLREQQGLKQVQIANNLNLDLEAIDALERDDYSQLPPAIFIQGYIRAYAKILHADPDLLTQRYHDQEGHPIGKLESMSIAIKKQKASAPQQAQNNTVLVISLLILFGIGIIVAMQQNYLVIDWDELSIKEQEIIEIKVTETDEERSQREAAEAAFLAAQQQAVLQANNPIQPNPDGTPVTETIPLSEQDDGADQPVEEASEQDVNSQASVSATADTDVADTENQQNNTATNQANNSTENLANTEAPAKIPANVADSATDNNTLLVKFKGVSWTEIYDADGQRLYYGNSIIGEEKTLVGKPPFKVKLGKPEFADIIYQGKLVDNSDRHGKVTRFTLGKAATSTTE